MDAKDEYNRIADSLRDHIELLALSGITHIPAPEAARSAVKPEAPVRKATGLKERVDACSVCAGAGGRKKVATGALGANARLVFVGGNPSEADAVKGAPFSGEEGELLTKMIEAMGFKRETVYILNSVRCASSGEPTDEEVASCKGFLEEELGAISPKVVVTLGCVAALSLLGGRNVGALRGRFHERGGVKVMATYGTAELLKDPSLKKDAWEDLKMVMKELKKR
ncbi:MAG: uracil-DNA glycosylase [Deltaproteobacteria bacterium]|nr:uracil-DNA glycosylase [Deltaproteobacteria bacterium]